MPDQTVNMLDETGAAHAVPADLVPVQIRRGWTVEGTEHGIGRVAAQAENDSYSGLGHQIDAYAAGAVRGATGGLSDVALSALGGDSTRRELANLREYHPVLSGIAETAGGIAGLEAGGGPLGEVGGFAKGVATAPEGASAIARIGRAAAGGAIEGAAFGAGSGVSDLALSDDPITVERAVSTLSSKMLYGGLIGGAAGGLGKSAEIGLVKAKGALDDLAVKFRTEPPTAPVDVGADLSTLDSSGLDAAEQAERDSLEAARVPQRKTLADDLEAYRREMKSNRQFLVTKDVTLDKPPVPEGGLPGSGVYDDLISLTEKPEGMPDRVWSKVQARQAELHDYEAAVEKISRGGAGAKYSAREMGKLAFQSNAKLDRLLNNPIALAEDAGKAKQAIEALQQQDNALQRILDREDDLRAAYAAEKGPGAASAGSRAQALDTVAPTLEKNRALQARLKTMLTEPTSERLAQIEEARHALQTSSARRAAVNEIATSFIPRPVAAILNGKVMGRVRAVIGESAARSAKAVGKIFEVGARAIREAPPVATAALAQASFGRPGDDEPEQQAPLKQPAGSRGLAPLFHQRSAELRENMTTGPDGLPQVKPAARARIAQRLQPIAVAHPTLADRMETLAVKRLEFLAGKLPRRPELGGIPTGPDRWQPSDMEMRTFARYVAAVEDPDGIVERVASGAISPEDAEVMREVYPARLAELTQQVLDRMPTLRQSLPYQRRLALSILTGAPVDPSMEPRILATLQGQYQYEPDRPTPKPQFGSVSAQAEVGTKSERRERGEL